MKIKKSIKDLSIRSITMITFITSMSISIIGIGTLVFSNWANSARLTTQNMADDMNQHITHQVDAFMSITEHINDVNHQMIENGILDLSNEQMRDKFFVGVLKSYEDAIYSFSYGTIDGEYYGARRNSENVIEIMKNNASTGGNSWYYSVNEDLTAGDLVLQAGQFDVRTRAWYLAAAENEGPTFSPIYKHFVMDNLTVSYAWPIYNEEEELTGVLGVHMLLTGVGGFLEEIVEDNQGYALIVERLSGTLIANSFNEDNYEILDDRGIERNTLSDLSNPMMFNAYEHYRSSSTTHFLYEGETESLYMNFEEYHKEGLGWVIISAIPSNLLIGEISSNIITTIFLVILMIILSAVIYYFVTKELLKPVSNLIEATENLAQGNLSKRVVVARNDELGRISSAFNKMADKMYFLINHLETTVNERTDELHQTNRSLEESKDQLRLILDSTAEAIYGINKSGNCVFCNASCLHLLGYNSQEELLGKHMHTLIHAYRKDGTLFPEEECLISRMIKNGEGTHTADEVFWRADGSSFEVEYYAYPQYKDDQLIGAVVTFMDITKRRRNEEKIEFLSYHDSLTGLNNRRYFEDSLKRNDTSDNLPLTVIFADINGLKMTNDIFGHATGDALIKQSAEILKKSCREMDEIARIGGDEFVMILPRTNSQEAEGIIARIKSEFSKSRIAAIKCSISLGYDTKTSVDQSIEERLSNAENEMYKEKTLNRDHINADIIKTIIETLHTKSKREKDHSIVVSRISKEIGKALHLNEKEIKQLEQAGYLHNIGKIILDDQILNKDNLSPKELEIKAQHPVVGYRILNLFDTTLDLAEGVYCHHERWDGTGYPKGLIGKEIPLMARIIAVAEAYDKITNSQNVNAREKKIALEQIKTFSGTRLDPEIVKVFINLMAK